MGRVMVAFAMLMAGACDAFACAGSKPPPEPKPPSVHALSLHRQAIAAEKARKNDVAVQLYVKAATAGSGDAAMRLGDIYDKGQLDQARDYSESLKWYNLARVLGALPPSTCR